MIRRTVAPVFLLPLALAGCGGHDSASAGRTAPAAMRALVVRTLSDLGSTCAYQQNGPLQYNSFGDVPTGGFSVTAPTVNDPLVGTPESGPLPTAYQNDGLGLWENLPNGDYSREDFYVDSSMAQTAGFSTDVTSTDGATTTETTHYEITAGDFAGSSGDSTSEFRDGTDEDHDYWHTTYRSIASDGTVYAGEFTYTGLAFTSTTTTTYRDGTTDTASADIDAKDRGSLTFTSHEGVTLSAKFTDTGIATGNLTGTADGLPATFSLNTLDRNSLTVSFSDGGKVQFKDKDSGIAPMAKRKAAVARHRALLHVLGRV